MDQADKPGASPTGKVLGWVVFAQLVLVLAGVLNIIYGIAALGNSSFFVHNTHYMFGSLETWGVILLILGCFQIFTGFVVWFLIWGSQLGRWFTILVAGLSAIGALLAIPAYPLWSLAIFALDLLVIYGLAAHGEHSPPA